MGYGHPPKPKNGSAWRHPQFEQWFATPQPVWPALKEILSLAYAADAVRSMHDTGMLRAIFPEMAQIENLVIRDFYHRYTVDEHTLVTLRVLAELGGNREPAVKRYTDLLSEMDDPALLRCALLFHDVGKGGSVGGHAEASARVAEIALERIGMSRQERELVVFLIRRHLEMSAVMTSRDLQDPATARLMAGRVETVERLRALTLLTYADISAVNPAAMTPWRAEVLWQLYLLTYYELTRELASSRIIAPSRVILRSGRSSRGFRCATRARIQRRKSTRT